MTPLDAQTVLLAAAEHEAFEPAFGLPGFARTKALTEAASDVLGEPIAAADLLAGGRLDTRTETWPSGWSSAFFEAIFRGHQQTWNGGPRR